MISLIPHTNRANECHHLARESPMRTNAKFKGSLMSDQYGTEFSNSPRSPCILHTPNMQRPAHHEDQDRIRIQVIPRILLPNLIVF